jgi:hypothetical protein
MSETTSDSPPGPGGCGSLAGGLWLLLGGVWGAVWLAWEGNSWSIALPAYIAVVGVLLLLETVWLSRKSAGPSKVLVLPGAIVTLPERAATTEPAEVVRQAWRMPIWMHLVLQAGLAIPGFFGGAILGFCTAAPLLMGMAMLFRAAQGQPPEQPGQPGWGSLLGTCCNFAIGAPLFFGGAVLGGSQVQRLWIQYISARCPQCGGDTHCKIGKPITYHCRSCGHVHFTKIYVK